MSLLSKIEDEFVKVEHFVTGIVNAILPVVAIVNPTLAGEAKLAVDILNAIALNTSNASSQTAISQAISAITANPAIASTILSKINLNAVTGAVSDVGVVVKAANDLHDALSSGATTTTTTATVTQTVEPVVAVEVAAEPETFRNESNERG